MHGARTALGYVDRNTATRVAKLLASDDPRELMQGLQIATRNQRVMAMLRDMSSRAATALGSVRRPRIPLSQLPTSADDNPFNQFDAKASEGPWADFPRLERMAARCLLSKRSGLAKPRMAFITSPTPTGPESS
jgi:hypothetical protein